MELITRAYLGAISENIGIHVWRGAVDIEAVRVARRFVEQWDDGVRGALVVIEESATLPTQEARAEISSLHDHKRLRAVAIACEGTGFGPAAARAVLTGMHILKPPSYESKVFPTVSGAARWTVQSCGLLGANELLVFVAALRRRAQSMNA